MGSDAAGFWAQLCAQWHSVAVPVIDELDKMLPIRLDDFIDSPLSQLLVTGITVTLIGVLFWLGHRRSTQMARDDELEVRTTCTDKIPQRARGGGGGGGGDGKIKPFDCATETTECPNPSAHTEEEMNNNDTAEGADQTNGDVEMRPNGSISWKQLDQNGGSTSAQSTTEMSKFYIKTLAGTFDSRM